jgi:hypothetical protein
LNVSGFFYREAFDNIGSKSRIMRSVGKTLGKSHWQKYVIMAFVAASIAGCRGEAIERATVSGKVTVDGKPLPSGQIRFLPTSDKGGPVWSAWIKDGSYTTAGTKGTPVGDLRVEINGFRTPSWFKPSGAPAAGEEEGMIPQEQYLPAKYNIQTELKMSIVSGSGTVQKDWELTSR